MIKPLRDPLQFLLLNNSFAKNLYNWVNLVKVWCALLQSVLDRNDHVLDWDRFPKHIDLVRHSGLIVGTSSDVNGSTRLKILQAEPSANYAEASRTSCQTL